MAVIRVNKTDNYTVMSNYHLRDMNLTLKAKGLLSQMLSLPPSWDYTIAGLVAINKEKESAINSTLKELKANGYLQVTKLMPNQTESGRIEYIYDIYEQPRDKQAKEKQGIENQGVELQGLENQGQIKKEKIKTEKQNTDNKKRKKESTYETAIDEYTENSALKNAILEFIKMRQFIKKPMTDRALALMLKRLDELAKDDTTKIQIIDQSILNNWQGIFPLKEQKQYGATGVAIRAQEEDDLAGIF